MLFPILQGSGLRGTDRPMISPKALSERATIQQKHRRIRLLGVPKVKCTSLSSASASLARAQKSVCRSTRTHATHAPQARPRLGFWTGPPPWRHATTEFGILVAELCRKLLHTTTPATMSIILRRFQGALFLSPRRNKQREP